MASSARRDYAWLWVLALAMGWFEASVVVYLRALYYPGGFSFPVVLLPTPIAHVEVAREAASLILLAAAARLAGRHSIQRWAAFLLLFGVWDLSYYGFLELILGWPADWATWDILFLIPVPWIGPVWAPCVVAVCLTAAGSYLYLTSDRPRHYRSIAWLNVAGAGLLVIVAFTRDWRVVVESRVPAGFPSLVFWIGVAWGVTAFLWAEFGRQPGRSQPTA
jgi:hypothetical protein